MDISITPNVVDGIRPAMVDRRFLHSNSTSHEWMFGAIAELIDNACDPDVNANQFWIDVLNVGEHVCLSFMDNGAGMDTETLHRMLSFGFSDKQEANGHLPIGRYGNGFKSGSMRLGRDAVVFTRQHNKTMSVGFLSQTYLDRIDSQTVVVPIVTWDVVNCKVIYPDTDCKGSLDAILTHSLFKTEDELLDQLSQISTRGLRKAGTRIFIYNLAQDESGNLELDFTSDIDDIRIPQIHLENRNIDKTESAVSLYRVSLRKYVSILYLKPRMQIFLRGKKVKSLCLSKLLTNKKQSTYMPKIFSLTKPIRILFGQNPNEDEHGIMMFNRNRLIQAFRKNIIRKQNDNSNMEQKNMRELMEVVIGVVELDCLTPNHIKQGFQDDNKFRTVEQALTTRLANYCADQLDEYNESKTSADPKKKEKDLWVQCDNAECQRWRRLPYGTKADSLPEKWFCRMNPDPLRNVCGAPEEPEKDPEMQKTRKPNPKRRQSKPDAETQPSTSEQAATPSSPAMPTASWQPSDPVSPSMERVLHSLNEQCVRNMQAPPPGATANTVRRLIQVQEANSPAQGGATVSGLRRQLPLTAPSANMSPPLPKRHRPSHIDPSVQPRKEQEVIVLDDDEEESSGSTQSGTSKGNKSCVKAEPIEVDLCASDNAECIEVKTEPSFSVPVEPSVLVPTVEPESSVNEINQSHIKPDPSSSPPPPDQPSSVRDRNSLLRELGELRAKVATQEVIHTRLENNIRDLLEENQQKDARIQELEDQLEHTQTDSQDDVIVIEDRSSSSSSDKEACRKWEELVRRYMCHLIAEYETPDDPQALQQDFANLINVRSAEKR